MWYKNVEEFKSSNGYEINNIWYPRVTKILEVKAKPALENFLKEMGSYAMAEDVKNKSAAEGTQIHEIVGKIAMGQEVTVPKEIYPAIGAFQKFSQERKIIFHPEFIERKIWSIRHRYAGTIDALATVDGKFGVLDIKTSTGFYPEYNLQTAAYASALQEFPIRQALLLPSEITTRWILRINQHKICKKCRATLRQKGGRDKVRLSSLSRFGRKNTGEVETCQDGNHEWGEAEGEVELKEFPYLYRDIKAFVAAKILWEWENDYWLKNSGYIK